MKPIIFLFLIVSAIPIYSWGQVNCPNISVLRIDSIGDSLDDLMPWPLQVSVSTDSIIVHHPLNKKNELISLNVLSKKCDWDNSYLFGQTLYQAYFPDKKEFLTVIINFQRTGSRYLELIYPDCEKRILHISKYSDIN